MTLPYSTQSGKIVFQESVNLYKSLNYRIGDFKALRGLNADLKQLSSIRTGARAATNPISAAYKKLEFDIGNSGKKLSGIQKITDALKKGAFKEINPTWGARLSLFLNVLNAGFTTFLVKKQEEIQAYDIATQKAQDAGLADAFTRSINNSIQIKGQQKQIEKIKLEEQRTRDRVYAAEKEQIKQRQVINDITYEVREGRKILEEKITKQVQSANTKIQELTTRFNTALGNTANNAQNAVQNAISKLQQQVAELQKPSNPNQEIPKLQTRVDNLTKTVDAIPQALKKVVEVNNDTTKKVVDAAFRPIQQAQEKWGVTITPSQVSYPTINYSTGGIVTSTPATVTPAQVRFGQFSSSDLGQQARVLAQDEAELVELKVNAVNGRLSTGFQQIEQARNIADAALREAKIKGVPVNTIEIENRVKEQESRLTTGLNTVNSRIGNIEKVNEQGNRKLDDILGKMNAIIPVLALIPAKAAQAVKQDIPSVGDIEAATGRAMCRNLQTGCGRKALDDLGNNINQHTTNNTGNVLDGVNAALNGAELGLIKVIDAKLGTQLPGGLSGTFGRLWKTLQVDRVIGMFTLITTFHNAMMLSNNVLQTLFSGIDAAWQVQGFKWYNEKNEEESFSQVVSGFTKGFFENIFGKDTIENTSKAFNLANRVYQSATNILWNIQGMFDGARSVAELTSSYVGKIGNALKRSGAVFENAYQNMTETITARTSSQAKWDNILQNLEPIENAASAFSSVTGEIVSIGDNFNELKNQRDEFVNTKNEAITAIDAFRTREKTASAISQNINYQDVIRNE